MEDILQQLANAIAYGLPSPDGGIKPLVEALFGNRYAQRSVPQIRDATKLGEDGAPFAGLIHPDNPTSGAYAGDSLIWFPSKEGSILTYVVGTGGLGPDEGLLSRPGHRRRIAALRRYLSSKGFVVWTKADPTALNQDVPEVISALFVPFTAAITKYKSVLYTMAQVPKEPAQARVVVQAFLDLYARERGWQVLKAAQGEYNEFHAALNKDLLPSIQPQDVYNLLKERRFVVLQGPPGTGKTRMAEKVRDDYFAKHGMAVQFHPAVTYEDFMVGLSPDPTAAGLSFKVRPGWLLQAAKGAKDKPFLLIIDEINRADLGKVLGEAIYLFEPGHVGGRDARSIQLTHPVDESTTFSLPENLYVLATMNTADRSIAGMDLAVRRRFAFMRMLPDLQVVEQKSIDLAIKVFTRLASVFIEHAPDDALDLLPGHSYFLADDEAVLRERFKYELVPLLDEYLQSGLLGGFASELQAVRDAIEDVSEHGQWPE